MSTKEEGERTQPATSKAKSVVLPGSSYVQFAEEYGLHPAFVPFAGRPWDRLDDMVAIKEYLTGRPPYCRRVSRSQIGGSHCLDRGSDSDRMYDVEITCLLHGWWPVGSGSSTFTHYGNPYYAHPDAQTHITEPDERRDLFQRAAGLGLVDPDQLLPALGVRTDQPSHTVAELARQVGVDWEAERLRGRETMARTFATIAEWGYSHREIAVAFGISDPQVSQWTQQYCPEFEPPSDPTAEGGR